MSCSYKFCNSNSDLSLQNPYLQKNIALAPCPFCKISYYCSEKCRILDWNSVHKYSCSNMNETAQNISRDAQSDMSHNHGIKRSLDDYEEIKGRNNSSELGKGSFGTVRRVREKKTGQEFAIKTMSKKSIFDFSSVENLKREIKIQKKLSHPHIIKLMHYFEDKENVYLVLEYAENGSLFRYLKKKGKFTEHEAFVYFFQTCLGIDYLHKQNIIHRDLKPENLLLDKQGNIKICDFGWSAESLTTKRYTFCGTTDYMAPEMVKNAPHDFKLDIWSLGVLLYELTHGEPPFKGKTEDEKFKNILRNQGMIFDEGISFEERDLILKILKTNPQERLSMEDIFHHSWMMNREKEYKINIEKYIWKDEKKVFNNPQSALQNVPVISNGKKDSMIIFKNVANAKNLGYPLEGVQSEYTKYMSTEDASAADSKKTFAQIVDVEKCLNELKYDQPNRHKTIHFAANLIESENDTKKKFDRARSKDQYPNNFNEFQKKKSKEFEKLLGEENEKQRISKTSFRARQIEDQYYKNKYDENKDASFFDKILITLGCISRDRKSKQTF